MHDNEKDGHMRKTSRTLISAAIAACLLVLMLVFAACGGDNSNASSNGSPAYASSGKQAAMTVNVKETKGSDGKDVYTFDPATITVNKGDSVTIQNQSDELQDVDEGDAASAGIDAKVPVNASVTVTFSKTGTFTLKSEKGATITVTVK